MPAPPPPPARQILEDSGKSGKSGSLPSGTKRHPHRAGHHLQPLEVGMFILLAVFCVVIAVFIAACFVYAGQVTTGDSGVVFSLSPGLWLVWIA